MSLDSLVIQNDSMLSSYEVNTFNQHDIMQHMRTFILFLYITLSSLYATAINLSSWKVEEMPNINVGRINCIYSDSKGFLWIGTTDQLLRYDGYACKSYSESVQNSTTPKCIMIKFISEDANGNIWVCTSGRGLYRLDPKTEKLSYYNIQKLTGSQFPLNNILHMYIDTNNYIWLCHTYGVTVCAFSQSTLQTKHYPFLVQEHSVIRQIIEDKLGNIWMKSNSEFKRIGDYTFPKPLDYDIIETGGAQLETYQDGLMFKWRNALYSLLPTSQGYQKRELAKVNNTTAYFEVGKEVLLLSKDSLSLLSLNNNSWTKKTQAHQLPLRKEGYITLMSKGLHGDVFSADQKGKVIRISRRTKGFKHLILTDQTHNGDKVSAQRLFEDSHGTLWCGTSTNGLYYQKPEDRGTKRIKPFDLSSTKTIVLAETHHQDASYSSLLWIATTVSNKLISVDPASGQLIKQPNLKNSIGRCMCIAHSPRTNTLWVGTDANGLWRLRLNKQGIIQEYKKFMPNTHTLVSDIITSLHIDQDSNLWIGTNLGLNLLSIDEQGKGSPTFASPLKPYQDYILTIKQGDSGSLWLGTLGEGLIYYHPISDKRTHIAGLANISVRSIEIDEQNCIWMGTGKGLCKYTPQKKTVDFFNNQDGVLDDAFNDLGAIKAVDGSLIFAGQTGLTIFHPSEVQMDTIPPVPFFTDLYINGHRVAVEAKGLLPQSMEYTKEVRLPYSKNNFTIGFTALQYNSASQNQFKYKLEGIDKEWHYTGAERRAARYTNIHEGRYTFKLLSANGDQYWTSAPATIEIIVESPWYRSIIAYIVYVALGLVIIWMTYRWTRNRAKQKHHLELVTLEKENVEKQAAYREKLFTNISHEFRTPLTLISVPTEQLMDESLSLSEQDKKEKITLIKQNTEMLTTMINEFLDSRKLEKGKMKLSYSTVNINVFTQAIYTNFAPIAEQKHIKFDYIPLLYQQDVVLDTALFQKVLYNLLSNSFKFTQADGHITLSLHVEGTSIEIIVEDDGPGVRQGDEQHIFERYYQSDNQMQTSIKGTGIGLAQCKDIVELHQGTIHYKAVPTGGARFVVHMPMSTVEGVKAEQIAREDALQIQATPVKFSSEDIINNPEIDEESDTTRVLIVEDNQEIRQQLAAILSEKYEIIQARDGKEGLTCCEKYQPEMIITDVMMPEMNGIEMCAAIKSDERTSHIPILVLSAKNTVQNYLDSFSTGADAYLAKPFNIDVLKKHVEAILKNRAILKKKFSNGEYEETIALVQTDTDKVFLKNIYAIVDKHMVDANFGVEFVADQYGVSRIYLNQKIKALTGTTAKQFLIDIQMNKAKLLLEKNTYKIAEVTHLVGFRDGNAFRLQFKKKFGVTPSQFVKHLAQI